jgi:hypothetical protein
LTIRILKSALSGLVGGFVAVVLFAGVTLAALWIKVRTQKATGVVFAIAFCVTFIWIWRRN